MDFATMNQVSLELTLPGILKDINNIYTWNINVKKVAVTTTLS